MRSLVALVVAYALLLLFSLLIHVLHHASVPLREQKNKFFDRGIYLGFILSIMVATILWLFLLSKRDALTTVQLIFFLQGLLFINFYLYVLAQDWALYHYDVHHRETLFFRALLISGFAMMLLDFFLSVLIFAAGLIYALLT